jgi:SAM-dependent methyltransferase
MSVIWHDLECGGYTEDLPLWRALAAQYGGPVLDVGAGTGRVALDLARAGHAVTALDVDGELLAELGARADGLEIITVVADARRFELDQCFALCIVAMQTIQLLGGVHGRAAFLRCARKHLRPGGAVAVAIADRLDLFDVTDGEALLLPDVRELDGIIYSSWPIEVRADGDGFVLIRNREVVTPDGSLSSERDEIRIDALSATQLECESVRVGLQPAGRAHIAQTADHVGSAVVMLSA